MYHAPYNITVDELIVDDRGSRANTVNEVVNKVVKLYSSFFLRNLVFERLILAMSPCKCKNIYPRWDSNPQSPV